MAWLGTGQVQATTCAGAITLNPASLPITNQALVCGGANDLNSTNVPGALCGTGDIDSYKNGNEALYTLTPTTTGLYNVSVSGQTWSSVQVWAGCPTSGGTCIYGDGNSAASTTITVTLNAGTQYYIWFDTWPTPTSPCPGTFSIGPPPPPPANDNPCGATTLTANASCVYTSSTTVNATATTGVPAPGCASYNGGDVWFKVVVPPSGGLIFDTNTGVITDGGMALYTAPACSGPFTLVTCDDDASANGAMPRITAGGLTPGSTVYVRFWEYGNDNPGTFSICAQTYAPPTPPANDNPCNATVAAVNSGTTCVTQTPGTVAGATASGLPATPCFGTPDNDVWFQFTATNTTHYISLNNVVGNTTDMYHAIYSGSCGSLTNIACSDADQSTVTGLTVGNTYWIRVYTYWANSPAANTTFNLCITSPPPPPVCGGMFYDSGGASGNYSNNENYTYVICPPPGQAASLLFTQFNTESIDDLIIYDGNSTAAPVIGTYSGTTLPPPIIASNPTGCLTVVFDSDGSVVYGGWAANVNCQALPAGDCVYILRLHDSAGNGWGSSAVRYRINGGAWNSYTVTASDNFVLIGVNMGDLIEIDYVASGPNQGQNSWTISKLGQFPYYSSPTPPTPGIAWSQVVTCGPPPNPPQDCLGGITICNSQSITHNSTDWGWTMDLNSGNQGCLSSEHQGTWYFFSPQTAGTVGFTITPSSNDDYDFAVWGPFSSAQCPTGPPLRCSWNAPGGQYLTGLGNGASDVSEGASGDGWVQTINVTAGQVYVMYIDNWSSSGQAFTLNWQLSGTSLDCTVLPMELLTLEAVANDPVVHVQWATATEQNTSHFVVERSPDNVQFTPIGTVQAAGNSQFRTDYLFVDEHPLRGVNYYRLEQVDHDGASTRTHTVTATLSLGSTAMIFPNPATNILQVLLPAALGQEARIVLQDAVGRTVADRVKLDPGQTATAMPLDGLAKGWYRVSIAMADGTTLQGGTFLKY